MIATQTSRDELPGWFWLGLPIAALAIELGFRMVNEPLYRRLWESELGPVETGTVVILVPGIVAGVWIWRQRAALPHAILLAWIAVVLAGSIYFGGEEASWGQHWFGWQTPEALRALNDQQETNMHNMSSWLDQKPRLLLELGVLVGGLLYPAWLRLRKQARPSDPHSLWYWIWPTRVVLPTALLATLIVIPQRLDGAFGWPVPYPLDIRASETQEFYFALFIALYLCSFAVRLARHGKRLPGAP